jgi:hypothetical protein
MTALVETGGPIALGDRVWIDDDDTREDPRSP